MSIPPYEKSHSIALIGTLTSIVVLIITVYCVWYPYLETSQFISANCLSYSYTDKGPTTCQPPHPSPCSTIQPPDSPVTGYFNVSTWSTTAVTDTLTTATTPPTMTSTTSTAGTTGTTTASTSTPSSTASATFSTQSTPSATIPTATATPTNSLASSTVFSGRRKRYATITNWLSSVTPSSEQICVSFPCIQVAVLFRTTYGVAYESIGLLYTNYDQMTTYPKCSYSACGPSYADNYHTIHSMLNASATQFQCYVNLLKSPRPVLQQVNFSYAAAANSILWPILGLVIFGTTLIVFRCFAWHTHFKARSARDGTSPSRVGNDQPYAVNYTADRQANEVPFPPAYSDSNGISLQFPEMSEKNSAVDLGDGPASGAGGPAYPAQWVYMYPPQYEETRSAGEEKRPPGGDGTDFMDPMAATSLPGGPSASGWTSGGGSIRY